MILENDSDGKWFIFQLSYGIISIYEYEEGARKMNGNKQVVFDILRADFIDHLNNELRGAIVKNEGKVIEFLFKNLLYKVHFSVRYGLSMERYIDGRYHDGENTFGLPYKEQAEIFKEFVHKYKL